MIISTMRNQVSQFTSDPDQTRYTATQYLNAINRAQEQMALDTRALFKDKSWSHVAGDVDEDLPSDFLWEDLVTYGAVELTPTSRHELNRKMGEDWSDDEADLPTHYIIDPEQAVKEIVLWPEPQTAKTLIMRYYAFPAALSADSDTPLNSSALMVQFHMGICAFAAWLILLSETEVTPFIIAKRQELLALYNDACAKADQTFKNTASAPLKIRGTRIYK